MANLRSTLASVFNVRPGEGARLLLLLAHSFAQGLSLVFLETPANTLFLSNFPVVTLPYVYIATAVVSTLMGYGYARLEARFAPAKLLTVTLVVLSAATGFFYLTFQLHQSKWLAIGLMIWKDVWWALTGIEFWALAGFLFNVRQGKRLFGVVGTGEVVAGILGGLSVPVIVTHIGTVNLLLISTGAMLVSLAVLSYTLRFEAARFAPAEGEAEAKRDARSLMELFRERYLFLFLGLTILSLMSYYFIDYVFYEQVENAFPDEAKLAGFFGVFYALLSLFDLVSSAFVSGRLLTRYGLSFGLLLLPIADGLTTGSAAVTAWTVGVGGLFLWLVVTSKLFDEVFRSSVQAHALRILYQPLPRGRRLRIQAVRESIVEPAAVGIAGILLLLLTSVAKLSAPQLLCIALALLAAGVAVSLVLRREYTVVLTRALTSTRLRGLDLTLDDESTLAVLQKGLNSPTASEVIYCLRVLEDNEHESLPRHLLRLLDHREPPVRRHVLERIEYLRLNAAVSLVSRRVDAEPDSSVRGRALRTLCAIGGAEILTAVPPYLEHEAPEVRQGALVGLLRSGGIDGVLAAGATLNRLLNSPDAEARKLAAQVLGDVGIFNFYQPLLRLMLDPDVEVCRVALEAAGKVKNLQLMPRLLDHLADPDLREAACSALVQLGESGISHLAEVFDREDTGRGPRNSIARVCGRIGGPAASAMLSQHLTFPDETVREHILSALVLCKYNAGEAELLKIKEAIRREVEDATWALVTIEDIGIDESGACLRQALMHEVHKNRERALLLLSFIHQSEPMLRAKAQLESESAERRAGALEALDNLVAQDLKHVLFPLLDDLTPEARLARLRHMFPQRHLDRAERLREVVLRAQDQATAWIKTCALYTIGKTHTFACHDCVVAALSDPDPIVRETAVWALFATDATTYRQHLPSLLADPSPLVLRAVAGLAGTNTSG